jgi:hypothetical protein
MAVVRLLQRKWAERDEKRPGAGARAGPHGSDNLPGIAAFCGIPTADHERKKNVPTGETGGASGIRTLGAGAQLPPISLVANNSKQRVLQAPDLNLLPKAVLP